MEDNELELLIEELYLLRKRDREIESILSKHKEFKSNKYKISHYEKIGASLIKEKVIKEKKVKVHNAKVDVKEFVDDSIGELIPYTE